MKLNIQIVTPALPIVLASCASHGPGSVFLPKTVKGQFVSKPDSFEPAPVKIFSLNLDLGRLPASQDGPVSITAEFQVDPARRSEFIKSTLDARLIFLRNSAYRWHLYEDLKQPNKFRMEVVVASTKADGRIRNHAKRFWRSRDQFLWPFRSVVWIEVNGRFVSQPSQLERLQPERSCRP